MVRWTRTGALARARSVSVDEARRHFLQQPLTWIGVGLAAVVLAVAGLFGGLRERSDALAVPAVSVGEAVDAGPWRISVERAFTIDELDGQYLSDEEANHWFGVVATVTVLDEQPNSAFRYSLQLGGVQGLERGADGDVSEPRVLRLDDASDLVLNPGVTERAVYLWEQANSAPVADEVVVEVIEPNRRRDSFTDRLEWMYDEPTTVGAVGVPVERLPTEAEG